MEQSIKEEFEAILCKKITKEEELAMTSLYDYNDDTNLVLATSQQLKKIYHLEKYLKFLEEHPEQEKKSIMLTKLQLKVVRDNLAK